ncbi:gamma-glutamylcyclotransferase [Candidatus Pelagibacter sp.]|nr:gamma-glutamylcyclotransferase [Candidatus Pelagibacter sp.]
MLYFAYGSNLNHQQMHKRCKGSKYIKNFFLQNYKLSFSHKSKNTVYGHANIEKRKNSKVPGAIWVITKKHVNKLDEYEGVSYNYYKKKYFLINKKKVLVYIQNKYFLKKPSSIYLHTIIKGYKDCNLDISYLKKRIKNYTTKYKILW